MPNLSVINRRAVLGGALAAASAPLVAQSVTGKRRIATVGTGHRGSSTWGVELLAEHSERIEFVGLCDINRKRAEVVRKMLGVSAPVYTDLDRMLREVRPDTLIVTTRDGTHHEMIIRGLEAGCRVLTEKPMTTDERKCQAILDAEKKAGQPITVTFNYRYSNTAQKIKELLMAGTIGQVVSVDFHWYLDTSHGADYFRRWHAYRQNSGSLFVHKASHHFDLINWYLDADPVVVSAQGALRNYGRNSKTGGKNCRECPNKQQCKFYWDVYKDKRLVQLYVDCESEDGYMRDACVYRQDIDIFDTMTGEVRYSNGAIMSYSLNTFMPYEGYHLAFNGADGRIETRVYERQPWEVPRQDEIRVTRNFSKSEVLVVKHAIGGHFGGDPRLRRMIFVPDTPDPLRQRAGSRAGAMSALTGIAAVKSADSGKPVAIADLIRL
ncbi:MAG: Gfo/Idh/MocA family oxidoreductase [Acidobacteria bacterium]|nr:Gfo/Idh/MocA family oxidoreductase [Acidobacteriota bacterium]